MPDETTQITPETGVETTTETIMPQDTAQATPVSTEKKVTKRKDVKKGTAKETKKEKPKKAEPQPPASVPTPAPVQQEESSNNKVMTMNTETSETEGEPEQAPPGLKAFILLDQKTGEPIAKYTNKQPRQAALKAAAEGHVDILIREVGSANSKRVAVLHHFTGERKQVPWADYGLPYNTYALRRVEELSGKPVPPELNVKGGAQALRDAGFKDFMFWKPNVKKVARINVPKVQGKAIIETVQEFVKGGLGA